MESFRLFLDICNNIIRKCNYDTSHPRWLQFRFNCCRAFERRPQSE